MLLASKSRRFSSISCARGKVFRFDLRSLVRRDRRRDRSLRDCRSSRSPSWLARTPTGRARRSLPARAARAARVARSVVSSASAALSFRLRVTGGLLDFRAGQFEQHGVGFNAGAGANDDLVDATFRARGDPADLFRHEQCRGRAPGGPSVRASRYRSRRSSDRCSAPPASTAKART